MKQKSTLKNNLNYTGEKTTPTGIHFIQYSENFFLEQKINDTKEIIPLMQNNYVHWIKVSGMNNPDLIVDLVKKFGLNILDAKDILTPQHIATVEEFDENIFIVLTAVYNKKGDEELYTEHIALILGKNYVISFQESNEPLFDNIYKATKENSMRIDNKNADFLLATLLNEIIKNYNNCLSQLEDSLEDLEEKLLDINSLKDNLISEIQEKRRNTITLRKILSPLKDQFSKLLRADNSLIQQHELPFYKDLYDQLLYVLQNMEFCREIISSLIDLYLNNNDLKMNFIMKRLTVVSTIFIPLTFLVGVWGMNFKFMPELDWKYGYFCAWGLMIITGIIVWIFLKKRRWF